MVVVNKKSISNKRSFFEQIEQMILSHFQIPFQLFAENKAQRPTMRNELHSI